MRVPGAEGQWPACAAAVYDDALPPALLARCAAASDALADCEPNFWVPRAAAESNKSDDLRTLAEEVVRSLHDRMLAPLLPSDWSGAEWWCQVYMTPGRGLLFHWDKDEAGLSAEGVRSMRHPLYSCVLYLNSEEECGRAPLGATAVLDQRWCNESAQTIPETCRSTILVWPRHNRLLVFDGELSHGVLDAEPSGATRRTLLVNWWAGAAPRGVNRPSADEFERLHHLPVSQPGLASEACAPARLAPLPHLSLSGAEEPLPLLEALEAAVPASGERFSASAGLASLEHPDSVLWQLEGEEGEQAPLHPALVPDHLLPQSESSEEESGEESGKE